MKKLLSMMLALIMVMTTLMAMPFNAFAKANPGDVCYGVELHIDGNVEVGKIPTLLDADATRSKITMTTPSGQLMGSSCWATDGANNSVSAFTEDKPLYYAYFTTNYFDNEFVFRQFNISYTSIFVNGNKILTYTGNVRTYESNGFAAGGLEIKVPFYRVKNNGKCIGYYSAGQNVEITAPAAPEGKHFVKWEGLDGNHQSIQYGDATKATTTVRIPGGALDATAVYEDHDFGADKSEEKCKVCGFENPVVTEAKAKAAAEAAAEAAAFVAPTLKVKAAKKSAKLTWNAIPGAQGYYIQYSADKKFKKNVTTVKIKKGTTVKKTIKKLKKGKKIYFRIRAYKKADGKTVKTAYSAKKKAKIK